MSSDSENDYLSDDEELNLVHKAPLKKQKIDKFNTQDSDSESESDADKAADSDKDADDIDDISDKEEQDDDEEQEDEGNIHDDLNDMLDEISKKNANKKLTPEQIKKQQDKIKNSGVIYLSSIPPYMKPAKLRSILTRFGKVGRIYLKPESDQNYKRRVKTGGNKKKKFEEGWAEFINKKDAKLCATTLNGNKLGGNKRNFYYDDIMNIKYLKGFKWFDLTDSINREIQARESKFQMELSQQHKINKAFIQNVETSKMIQNIKNAKKQKRKANGDDEKDEKIDVKRTFKQRNVMTNRADADDSIKNQNKDKKLESVLNSVF